MVEIQEVTSTLIYPAGVALILGSLYILVTRFWRTREENNSGSSSSISADDAASLAGDPAVRPNLFYRHGSTYVEQVIKQCSTLKTG